jgi:hypothetical protein
MNNRQQNIRQSIQVSNMLNMAKNRSTIVKTPTPPPVKEEQQEEPIVEEKLIVEEVKEEPIQQTTGSITLNKKIYK